MDQNTPQNAVDNAAASATKVIDQTRTAAVASLDAASSTVESMRSNLSPAVGGAIESVTTYTKEKPLNALLAAAAVGALLAVVFK